MRISLEPMDELFLQQIHQSRGKTVDELCETAGITATAVRQRLLRLQNQGLIERQTVRSGRGRPHHVYCVTDAGRGELGDNYAELAILLWDELSGIEEPEIRQRVSNRIRDALASRYGANVKATSVVERFDELRARLAEHGFRVEVEQRGELPILRETNCPYHDLAQRDRGICELEQQVYEQVLGVSLKLAVCCRDGHSCCEFHPV